jgi:hypothetical protein
MSNPRPAPSGETSANNNQQTKREYQTDMVDKQPAASSATREYLRHLQGWTWTEEVAQELKEELEHDRAEAVRNGDLANKRKAS